MSNHLLHKYSSDSLGNRSLLEFPKTFQQNTFSLREQKSHYVYGIWIGMSFLCSKSDRDQIDQDLCQVTLSGDFVSELVI